MKYKGKIENDFSDSKNLFLKHSNKVNRLHFYHQCCDLKLINNVTTCIRFYQNGIHKKRAFGSKFPIHIPETRPFKYYNYFDFFEFYQIHKSEYALDVARAFYSYLSETDTEVFTTFEKLTNPNGIYKSVMDYRVYFLVHENGYIRTIKTFKYLYYHDSWRNIKKGQRSCTFQYLANCSRHS